MSGLRSRIAAFEKAAQDAADPVVMASKISEFSDRKKYNFVGGMQVSGRLAMRGGGWCARWAGAAG